MKRALLAALAALVLSCHAENPPTRPEATCREACQDRARQCTEHQCARGCSFILDRLVEGQTGNVVACVAHAKDGCEDPVWARCAVSIGVHADGGPPAPPPPEE